MTQIEALGFPGISPEEETALLSFIQARPSYPLDDGVIQQAIKLRRQKKMKLGDSIIAATALEYEIPFVTRNEDDFKHSQAGHILTNDASGFTKSAVSVHCTKEFTFKLVCGDPNGIS